MNREPSDRAADDVEWEEDIRDELEEMQEQADEEYQKKMEKYEEDITLWKEQKQRKVSLCKKIFRCIVVFLHANCLGPRKVSHEWILKILNSFRTCWLCLQRDITFYYSICTC